MPAHYSPKHFLQQVSHSLLQEFFASRGELLDLDWSQLKPGAIEEIYSAWQNLPAPQPAEVERRFRAVWSLATREGLKTVIEESQYHKVSLTESLKTLTGLHEQILWVSLHHPKVFQSSGRLNHADNLSLRYWRLRNDLPAKLPDTSHPTRDLLRSEISEYFNKSEGRGKECTVEAYLRRETLHYIFVYPSDYADTALVYDDEGKLDRQRQKAAFQVIYAYDQTTGALDVFVQGNKDVRHDLEAIFCRLILKEELPKAATHNAYDLDPLRNPRFEFPTNPEDRILSTRVRALRLSVAKPGCGRITVEGDDRRKRGNVHDLMAKFLNQEQLSREAVMVTQAVLEVVFKIDKEEKKVRFTITHPDSCTLRDDPEHLIIKDCLRRWRIATGATGEHVLVAGGQ